MITTSPVRYVSRETRLTLWGSIKRLIRYGEWTRTLTEFDPVFPGDPAPSSDLRKVADHYFSSHPLEKDGVFKAWYAWHAPHFREIPELSLHNFTNLMRWSRCAWCGRSREEVRYDDLPAQCGSRPPLADQDISQTVIEEEEKAWALFERARSEVPRLVSKMGMSPETLDFLHDTHGFDPDTVDSVLNPPPL